MNHNKLLSLFWGLALIIGGGVFLASNYHLIPAWNNNPAFWIPVFAGLSVLFLASYFASATEGGPRQWGWLFPASICAGQAITISLAASHIDSPAIGFPTLFSVALPFFLGYLHDRTQRGLLIPFWVISVVAGLTLFVDQVQGELIPLYVLLSIAAPFWGVAISNRKNAWALIPAGVLSMIAFIPLMTTRLGDEWIGPAVMAMIALPFIVTALYSARNWWAQIPAGILLTIGVVALLAGTREPDTAKASLLMAVLFLGFALTFGLLWLRRATAPTGWAQYPAIGLALMAIFAYAFGADALAIVWPVVIIAGGLLLLYRSMRRPKQI